VSTTSIEWTDHTWNPVTGCDRTSPGCQNCYALTLAKRLKAMGNPRYQVDGDPKTSGPGFGVTLHPDKLDEPLHWRKPRRVFVNSMSDLFHPDVPGEFIVEVYARMVAAGQHTFQVLTKRPQRMAKLLRAPIFEQSVQEAVWRLHTHMFAGFPYPSVWLGTSIESDRYAFRADHLRKTPAAIRFLSLEPLLGPLPSLDFTGIDWVIVGGESGPGARPMHPEWVRSIRDQCVRAGVALFVKQLSSGGPHAIKDLDLFPEDLRIREFPA
jgi:protein gp37